MAMLKPATVAGYFYPDEPAVIRSQIASFLAQAKGENHPAPKALIAPHAGYVYSGPVAGSAYAQLLPITDRIRRVVILAPSHRLAFRGIAIASADEFQTPLGILDVDKNALSVIVDLPQVQTIDQAFSNEHSIEVHLPFLQQVLGSFQIVPLLVGDASTEMVEEVIERLWGGDETLIVISSDLSHYHDSKTARVMDNQATQAIETLNPDALAYENACGRNPIRGLLVAARNHSLQVDTLDLRNSGDTAGPKDKVVGYGAYVFY